MFKKILIPIALDHDTDIAGTIAIAERLKEKGGAITLVGVVENIPDYVAEYVTIKPRTTLESDIKKKLRELADAHGGLAVSVLCGKPGVVIAEMAEETGADLIVIGSHRPGVQEYFLGSTASRVVRRAPCAVMVVR